MKYPTKLSDAMHCLAFIELTPGADHSSAALAFSIQTNPSYLRQLMSAMKKAGLIESTRGKPEPRLARPADQITLLDVYRAVEGEKPLLHLDTHTNPACGVGINIQELLQTDYEKVQAAAEQAMQNITLADLVKSFEARADAGTLRQPKMADGI